MDPLSPTYVCLVRMEWLFCRCRELYPETSHRDDGIRVDEHSYRMIRIGAYHFSKFRSMKSSWS